jgi:3-oxoacyl-[acyl-carrier-protein] synthase III
VYEIALEVGKKALSTNQLDASKVKFIGPEFTVSGGAKLARELGVSAQNHWSLLAEVGNALGASPVLNLAAHWQEIQKGDLVVCVQVGVGVSYGYAVFEGL